MTTDALDWLEPAIVGLRIGAMIAVVVIGVAFFAGREGTSAAAASGGFVLTGLLLGWFAVIFLAARAGGFGPRPAGPNPLLPLAALAPPLLAWISLSRLRSLVAFVDVLPQAGLVGVQVFRVVGGVFLLLWASGHLPAAFALPVGIGDVLVGVLALPVARMNARNMAGRRSATMAWNLLGMADHLMALGLGISTSPGPLQSLALDEPNLLVGTYPLVLVPVFIVPLSLILHGLSLWKLRRERR